MPKQSPGIMRLSVSGHVLSGRKLRGKWTFECASFPEVAERFDGTAELKPAVDEFMRLALVGAVTVRELAEGVEM